MKALIILVFFSIASLNAQVFKCYWIMYDDEPVYVKVDSTGVYEVDTLNYDCELSMSFYLVGWDLDTVVYQYGLYKPDCFLFDIKPILSYFYEKKIKFATDRRCFVIKME